MYFSKEKEGNLYELLTTFNTFWYQTALCDKQFLLKDFNPNPVTHLPEQSKPGRKHCAHYGPLCRQQSTSGLIQ